MELVTIMLRKLNSFRLEKNGQFPDDLVKIEDAQMWSTFDLSCDETVSSVIVELVTIMLRKLNSFRLEKNGQFPDDLVKIEDAQIHCVTSRTY